MQDHALRSYLEQRDDRVQQSYLSQRKHRENLIRQARCACAYFSVMDYNSLYRTLVFHAQS